MKIDSIVGCMLAIPLLLLFLILRMAIIGLIFWMLGWMLELFVSDPLSLIGHKLTWFQVGALVGFISMFFRSGSSSKD